MKMLSISLRNCRKSLRLPPLLQPSSSSLSSSLTTTTNNDFDCFVQNFNKSLLLLQQLPQQQQRSPFTTMVITTTNNGNKLKNQSSFHIDHMLLLSNKSLVNYKQQNIRFISENIAASDSNNNDNSSTDSSNNRVVSFNLSDIGEGISEVTVKEWFVRVGDRVQQFDNICEVQSDKASVTITSRYDGVIERIYYDVDDMAKVGQPLVDIRIDSDSPVVASESSESDDNDTKSNDQQPQPQRRQHQQSNQTSLNEQNYLGDGKIITTPAVRRLAIEHRVNLNSVTGTGKDGRILKEDVLAYIEQQQHQSSKQSDQQPLKRVQPVSAQFQSSKSQPQRPIKAVGDNDGYRTEKFSNIIKGMYKTMTKSLSVPHFGLSEEVDVTKLIELRPEMKKLSEQKQVPITYMPFFIKAASLSLNEFPILNATIDEKNEMIVYKNVHNIGIAMDTDQGLLVPNIKNVNHLSILEIATELNRLQQLGQKGQLSISDLTGGTFTLSNIGSIGGVFGVPVLMPGEVAIGAIGRVRHVPRFVNDHSDQIYRASIVQVLWSADHRIIDGATMARFCKLWREYLENPFRIFF